MTDLGPFIPGIKQQLGKIQARKDEVEQAIATISDPQQAARAQHDWDSLRALSRDWSDASLDATPDKLDGLLDSLARVLDSLKQIDPIGDRSAEFFGLITDSVPIANRLYAIVAANDSFASSKTRLPLVVQQLAYLVTRFGTSDYRSAYNKVADDREQDKIDKCRRRLEELDRKFATVELKRVNHELALQAKDLEEAIKGIDNIKRIRDQLAAFFNLIGRISSTASHVFSLMTGHTAPSGS